MESQGLSFVSERHVVLNDPKNFPAFPKWPTQVRRPRDATLTTYPSFSADLLLLVVDVAGICGPGSAEGDAVKGLASALADSVGTLGLCFPDVNVEVVGFTHDRL